LNTGDPGDSEKQLTQRQKVAEKGKKKKEEGKNACGRGGGGARTVGHITRQRLKNSDESCKKVGEQG